MQKLLIATSNRGKVKELNALLAEKTRSDPSSDLGMGVQLVIPNDLGLVMEVVEDGETYEENAGKKARAYSLASGLLSLADDSGLIVDALADGRRCGVPGLYSARYSPLPNATDADRRDYLLKNLAGKPRPWTAHFHATIAIGHPDGRLFFAEGNCYGEIIPEERGENGFGYDPIFFIPEMQCSMAELSMQAKNRLSHRALAMMNVLPILQNLLME